MNKHFTVGRARLEPSPNGLRAGGPGDGALGREMKLQSRTAILPAPTRVGVSPGCLADQGAVGTEMPLDGDGTMVGDKITIALAP